MLLLEVGYLDQIVAAVVSSGGSEFLRLCEQLQPSSHHPDE